jgi:hypothetical protein
MLEFFILRALCGGIGSKATEKGLTAFPYQLLVVVLWFVGEIGGLFLGFAIQEASSGGESESWFLPVICAYLGAAAGAGISFAIVAGQQASETGRKYDGGRGADDRPWGGAIPADAAAKFDQRPRRSGYPDQTDVGDRRPDDPRSEGVQYPK